MELINNNTSIKEFYKKELLFSIDNFNRPAEYENTLALAKLIQNLILMEPGTYPNMPEMGVNIGKYRFEFLDSQLIRLLKDKITEQIQIYIPDHDVDYIHIEAFYNENKTIKNTLGLVFALNKSSKQIFLILKQDKHYNIISNLIL